MEKIMYTEDVYLNLVKLIGQKIFFFIKTQLPHAKDGQAWTHLPMIMPTIAQAKIDGVDAKIEKKATDKGIVDLYYDVRIVVRNPWYEKPQEVDDERGMGWPPPEPNGPVLWHFAPDCLHKWFFLSMADTINSIREWSGGTYSLSLNK